MWSVPHPLENSSSPNLLPTLPLPRTHTACFDFYGLLLSIIVGIVPTNTYTTKIPEALQELFSLGSMHLQL